MRFEKWQALGNDYVIIERAALPFELTAARVRRICEAHFGVGSDGVLLVERLDGQEAAGSLRIFNPDGSEAELSGNGAREAALYMHAHGWSIGESFAIATSAGTIRPTVTAAGRARIDIGRARLQSKDFPGGPEDGRGQLDIAAGTVSFQHVSVGNPQCSIHVGSLAELEALDIAAIGPSIESHPLFPNRTNVSWYAELHAAAGATAAGGAKRGHERIRARIFERGVGETLSSGTGAAGAAVAHVLRTGGQSPASAGAAAREARVVEVVLDGGELEVEVGEGLALSQSGWAKAVFAGELSDELLAELRGDGA